MIQSPPGNVKHSAVAHLSGVLLAAMIWLAAWIHTAAMLLRHDILQLQLEILTVRELDRGYALANGRVRSTWNDGHQQTAPFTVIYACNRGSWKLIYAHS